jgi:hypothetical protein
MTASEIFQIVATIIVSLGGAGVIVAGLASWLGKVWADRLIESQRFRNSIGLEALKAELSRENNANLEAQKARLSDDNNQKLELLKAELSNNNNRELELLKAQLSGDNNQKLELLKAELAVSNEALTGENKARRDYLYEARKRLYQEVDPLLFQLAELSENALHRIYSLARTARKGKLEPNASWLSYEGYYMSSTLYNLLVPLVIIRLIQRRLTVIDLTVDPYINSLYSLGRWVSYSFTDDFEFARGGTHENEDYEERLMLEYNPNDSDWETKRELHADIYWRQGLPIGILDKAVDSLIVNENDKVLRYKNFGEFENEFHQDSNLKDHFKRVYDIFFDFHPKTRPVLWRILVTQAHLYRAIIQSRDLQAAMTGQPFKPLMLIDEKDRWLFDWRQAPDEAEDEIVLVRPFEVAQNYLQAHLSSLLQENITGSAGTAQS